VLGKHSGRAALRSRLAELGFALSPEQLDAAYGAFTTLADRKKSVYDQDLINIGQGAAQSRTLVAAE
jgi:2-isopropylmalate synthase